MAIDRKPTNRQCFTSPGLTISCYCNDVRVPPLICYMVFFIVWSLTMPQLFQDAISCAKRDALISYYLGKNIANNPAVRTAEDLYDYLLIDPLVHSNVVTSELGESIASAQQYLNRAMKGLEPALSATPDEVTAWQQKNSRYAVWAGYQQLRAYPENYLTPTLRLSKTELFSALEIRLSQGRISDDGVQAAVLDYLNQFEEISNLDVVSGYQDGLRADKDDIYFIGRSKKGPDSYYWRSLNMDLSSDGAIHPDAWSEWKKIEGLSAATRGSVQPMCMNGRLYVLWCEATEHKETALTKEASKPLSYNLSVKLAFKRFDDSWSAPQEIHSDVYGQQPQRLIAVKDVTDSNNTFLRLEVYGAEDVALVGKTFDALLNCIDAKEKINLCEIYQSTSIQHPYNKSTVSYTLTGQSSVNVRKYPLFVPANSLNLQLQIDYSVIDTTLHITPFLSSGPIWYIEPTEVKYRVWILNPEKAAEFTLTMEELRSGSRKIPISLEREDEFQKLFHSVTYTLTFAQGLGPSREPMEVEILQCVDIHYLKANSNSKYSIRVDDQFIQTLVSAAEDRQRPPIRLNTLFAKELIRRGENGIDGVMAAAHVAQPGETISEITTALDFKGANSLYLWELFFHMPFLVAHRLNQEQRFEDATRWLHYLFDPSCASRPWNGRTLIDISNGANFIADDLTDPNARAMADPTLYRKAVFFSYVKNLIDQGDACYRELTRDGLADAKQWYKQALALLGQQPDENRAPRWIPQTTQEAFDKDCLLRLNEKADGQLHTGIFVLPRNAALHLFWTQLETRLFNLRHGLNIDGQLLSLPLFDAPVDPLALLASGRGEASSGRPGGPGQLNVPHYRFAVMINKANAAVEMLMQLGNALHNALERKDSIHLEVLQQDQQYNLLTQFTLGIQEESIALSVASQAALEVSKQAAQLRVDHYTSLVEQGQSGVEIAALAMHGAAIAGSVASTALRSAGGIADLAPNVFGLSNGGMRYGSVLYAASTVVEVGASVLSQSASIMEMSEQYRRRQAEWTLMRDQAIKEVAQIGKQLDVEKQQQTIQQKQLQQLTQQQSHLKETRDFLSTRFSGEALYQWMTGQLSTLYFQAYDGVMSLCLSTEAAWQYETGVFDGPRFIQPSVWNDRYHGMLVGESLKMGLQRLEQAYLMRNQRKLEIVHTVSLKALLEGEGQSDWKTTLLNQGTLGFVLTERHFAERYPGHYLRQIAAVSVTLPALVGPYQDIRAVLSQICSGFVTQPEIEGVQYLLDKTGNSSWVQSNLRAHQQVALSTGMDDSGAFQLSFGEERYLPFEGTGAVSSWQLSFPNHRCDDQQKMLASLTDIIVRVRYTARDGGPDFATKVQGLLAKPAPDLLS
ncbi:Tc toxin subunit A-related protein [Pseudomonas sp. RT6P73]